NGAADHREQRAAPDGCRLPRRGPAGALRAPGVPAPPRRRLRSTNLSYPAMPADIYLSSGVLVVRITGESSETRNADGRSQAKSSWTAAANLPSPGSTTQST